MEHVVTVVTPSYPDIDNQHYSNERRSAQIQ